MAAIELRAYEDDDEGDVDCVEAKASYHMEVYVTIDSVKYLLMIGHEADGKRACYWMGPDQYYAGDPTSAGS